MVIPEGWRKVRLGDLGSFSKGQGIKKDEVIASGLPCIRYGQIYTDHNDWVRSFTAFISPATAQSSRRLIRGDLMFTGSGETAAEIGKCVAFLGDEEAYAGGDIVILTPRDVDPKFMGYALNTPAVVRQKVRLAQGDAVVHISASSLASLLIAVPPLKEQEAIAEALSDADAAIEALDALIAKKRDVKQAAMQQLLTGRTRLPGFSEVWLDTTIGGVAQAISGGTPSTAIAAYWDGGLPWCTPTDITATRGRYLKSTERTITQLGISSSGASLLPAGALLLCTRATIGEVRIAAQPTATNQGFKSLVVRPGTSNIFLYYLLSTLRPKFIERASGSTFLEIGRGDLVSVDIRIPQENEQAAIAEVLSDMDADLEALVAERDKMRLVKQGLMQELLSGRVRLV